jgi:hypothetical protein
MGDFNIDLLKYNSHTKTNEYVDNVFSRGFLPIITKPTRIFQSSATLIDHIYTNSISSDSSSGIIITDVADHFGTFHIVNNKSINTCNKNQQKRIFSETNLSLFREYLDKSDFSSVIQSSDPDVSYNTFINMYKHIFQMAFPLKHIKPNKKYIKKEPWITSGLLTSMRQKTKLFTKKLKQPTELNISTYKNYLNQYNRLKRELKITYFNNKLAKNKHSMKKNWETLKRAIGKQNEIKFPSNFSY